MFKLAFAIFSAALLPASALAAPISLSWPGGDPSDPAPGFNWRGFDFVLDSQPGGSVNAAHSVSGDSDASIDITLDGAGKVTYRAQLPVAAGARAQYSVDYIYGADLEAPTQAFSFIQPFLRSFDSDAPTTALAGLYGSDAANPASPFSGVQARPDDFPGSGGFSLNAFLDNVAFGATARLLINTRPGGQTSATVSTGGESTGFAADLTGLSDAGPFYFEELLLQVSGEQGQSFTFVNASATVPVPASLALLGLGLAAIGAARRRG